MFKEMVIYVTVDCKSNSRQRKTLDFLISKGRKSATAMACKNKMYNYPVDTTYQNVSCLLL